MLQKPKNLNILVAFMLLTVLGIFSFVASGNKQGPHGGIVKKADNYFIEMKCAENFLYTYLLNDRLKTVDATDLMCEVKFSFPDSTDIRSQLKPNNDDGFICPAPIGFFSCKITFVAIGKSVSAEFLNPIQVVNK